MFRRQSRVPALIIALIIAAMLPVVMFPCWLDRCPADSAGLRTLLWCYPPYVLLTGVLAWMCWPERPYITWILIVILLLTHAAAWAMVTFRI